MTESITIEAKNKKHQETILEYFRDIAVCFPQYSDEIFCSTYRKDHPYTPKEMESSYAVYISFHFNIHYELVKLLHNSAKYVAKNNGTRVYYDEELIDCDNLDITWGASTRFLKFINFILYRKDIKIMKMYFNNYGHLLLDSEKYNYACE